MRVGFCLARDSPKIGIAVLNLNDEKVETQELLTHLSQGASLERERLHPRTGEKQDLVVGLRAEGEYGYYTSL